MGNINRKHKDRLFSFLFGNSDHKDWTLSLYNAVNGSCYDNPDDIQITTMGSVICMGMKNDVSFIISDMLNIYEQQSSFNPNMPIRLLMYAARLYDKYIHGIHGNIYGSSLVRLPQPKLVVFYNGPQERADTVLRLSDAFQADGGGRSYTENTALTDPAKVMMKRTNQQQAKNTILPDGVFSSTCRIFLSKCHFQCFLRKTILCITLYYDLYFRPCLTIGNPFLEFCHIFYFFAVKFGYNIASFHAILFGCGSFSYFFDKYAVR